MISAKEAKELCEKSEVALDKFLNSTIKNAIIEAANKGNLTTNIYIGSCPSHNSIDKEITCFYGLVIEKLIKLGYTASIDYYGGKYVPKGLQDNYGDGPEYRNYGFIISWK
jgi:hypothetical protein